MLMVYHGTAQKYFNLHLEELLANHLDNLGVKHSQIIHLYGQCPLNSQMILFD